jgi:hypothetical protein
MSEWKVPVQSLIDHIKTATDVDPWAKDMAAALLARDKPVAAEIEGGGHTWFYVCGECHGAVDSWDRFCKHCGTAINWNNK